MTKRQTELFMRLMLAWTEDRTDDAVTLAHLLKLYAEILRSRGLGG